MTDTRNALIFVGCYTAGAGGDGEGIVAARRRSDGRLTSIGLLARTPSPSFVVRHPELPVLYAVNELEEGTVTAFSLVTSPTGPAGDAPLPELVELGTWSSGGSFPCHLTVANGWLAVANYGDGAVAGLPLDEHGVPDGRVAVVVHKGHIGPGANPERQDGPHAHMVVPDGEAVLAIDLGLDLVLRHIFDPSTAQFTGTTEAAVLPTGSGPRHLVRDRGGRVHVLAELDPVVTTFDPGTAKDAADGWQVITRIRSTKEPAAQPSAIDISADGRFLYLGNRGPDTLAVIDLDSGQLAAEVSSGGAWPRAFMVVGSQLYVANERSHEVSVFDLDPETGVPQLVGNLRTPSPTSVLVM